MSIEIPPGFLIGDAVVIDPSARDVLGIPDREWQEPLPEFYDRITAWVNCDRIEVEIDGVYVSFLITELLKNALGEIDCERHPEDKQSLINDLLPTLKKTVSELEKRQHPLHGA